jgi:hypothetical protein
LSSRNLSRPFRDSFIMKSPILWLIRFQRDFLIIQSLYGKLVYLEFLSFVL